MTLDLYVVVVAAVLGALIGSFSNVLIYRLPRGESIAFPPSNCTSCHHRLGVLDLVPVVSWATLGARCRYCAAGISARYPTVELLTAAGYALLALVFPWSLVGAGLVGLWALFTLLLVISFIDAETRTIPDALVLPGVALGLALGYANQQTGAAPVLPDFRAALNGALLGTGLVAFIAMFGEWVLRRFRERRFPEYPVSYQQVALAAFAGAWLGPAWGVALAVLSAGLNLLARRVIRLPETLLLLGLLVSVTLGGAGYGAGLIAITQNALAAAGAMSLLAGLYWWTQPDSGDADDEDQDPIAMGFGDVKLAGLLGAFLGLTGVLVSLGAAILTGAVFGVLTILARRDNKVPFGPFLALGALAYLMYREPILALMQAMLYP